MTYTRIQTFTTKTHEDRLDKSYISLNVVFFLLLKTTKK